MTKEPKLEFLKPKDKIWFHRSMSAEQSIEKLNQMIKQEQNILKMNMREMWQKARERTNINIKDYKEEIEFQKELKKMCDTKFKWKNAQNADKT